VLTIQSSGCEIVSRRKSWVPIRGHLPLLARVPFRLFMGHTKSCRPKSDRVHMSI
jgi:hypothetical protein